ncbi:hypothetical protein, partial [Fulvivirga aurantia]|uniref:hypothetical protein n=1 Tax=Fulvivirga aurantia TaxID=2529383 RepID=UPI0016266E9F
KKIKSPYFDYENPEVKKALNNFMNLLSKNIAVGQIHLLPLLRDAIKETLLLIFSPYDFYMHQLNTKEELTMSDLKTLAKYVKINKNIIVSLIERLEASGTTSVGPENINKNLAEVFANTNATPEDVDNYLNQLSSLLPLDQSVIYGEISSDDEQNPDKKSDKKDKEETAHKSSLINEQYDTPTQVLNDRLADESKPTIADIHQKQKITDIHKHLSINQRFMFIRALFDGNEEKFKQTLSELESFNNQQSAFQYLSEEYPNWDNESEEVEEFMEIVSKRLA